MTERDLDRLGFRELTARMARGCHTPRGSADLTDRRPARDMDEARARQQVYAEVARAVSGPERLPLREIPDVDPHLRRLRRAGAVLDGPSLCDLLQVMSMLEKTASWLAHAADRFPVFHQIHGTISRYHREEAALADALEADGYLKDDASPELARLRRRIRQEEEEIRARARAIALRWHEAGWAQEPEPVLREGRLVVAVRSDARGHAEGPAVDRSRSGQTFFIEPGELAEAGLGLKETRREEAEEVERIMALLSALCAGRTDDLDADLDRTAALDLHQAAARWEESGPVALPALVRDAGVELLRARHPLLAAAHGWREVVPLTLALGEKGSTLVISGPNSGGKTVALGTVGLCAALAAAGLPLPADEGTRMPFFSEILSDIGDEQSVEADLSTFTAHLQRVRPMLEAPGPEWLCLMDEAGAGTDPAQGAALAIAVLERLTSAGACVVCTTHNGRIKAFAAETDGVVNGRMVFDGKGLTPTYEFVTGEAGRSFAFEIAQRAGLPSSVVDRARELIDPHERQLEEVLREAEETRKRLQDLETRAAAEQRRAESARAEHERLAAELAREAEELRARARREIRELTAETRRQVEHLVKEIRESQASEGAIKAAHRELDRLAEDSGEAPPPPGGPVLPYHPIEEGEEVVLTRLGRRGVVQSVHGGRARVQAGNLSLDVSLVDLEPAPVAASAGRARPRPSAGGVRTPIKEVADRVELIGMRAEEAERELTRRLDDALMAGLTRVTVIHGVGTGTLRRTVHELLSEHPAVASFDLDRESPGGDGVTIIAMKGTG